MRASGLIGIALVGAGCATSGALDEVVSTKDAEIASLRDDLNAALGRIADLETTSTDHRDRLETLEKGETIGALAARVANIEADYLKSEDKTELEERIENAENDARATYFPLTDGQSLRAGMEGNASDIDNLDKRLGEVESMSDTHADELGALDDRLSSAETSIRDHASADGERFEDLEDRWIDTDTTWHVGPTRSYTTLSAAVDALDEVRIMPGAVLTVSIDDGSYTEPNQVSFDHPDGSQVELVGASGDPSKVTLGFLGSHGLVVESGASLGWVTDVTIDGDGSGGSAYAGVLVREGAFAHLGDVVTSDFGSGVLADQGGAVFADDGALTSESNVYGYRAANGGVIHAEGAVSDSNTAYGFAAVNNGALYVQEAESADDRQGFRAAYSGSIYADSSSSNAVDWGYVTVLGGTGRFNGATDTSGDGYYAAYGAVMDVDGSSQTGSAGTAYSATRGAVMLATSATSNNSGYAGFWAGDHSYVDARRVRVSNARYYGYGSEWVSMTEGTGSTVSGTPNTWFARTTNINGGGSFTRN